MQTTLGNRSMVAVGEILDPVNDLVESFLDLMLIASVAFGAQKVLLAWTVYATSRAALSGASP